MMEKNKEEILKLSIERAADAVVSVVRYSTDTDFSSQCHAILQANNNHGLYCKTCEAFWGTAETLFDINAFQCLCKRKFPVTSEDSSDDKSCGSLKKKHCTSRSPPCPPDFFQQVEDDYLDICKTDENSFYDDHHGTQNNDGASEKNHPVPSIDMSHISGQEMENDVQKVPNLDIRTSCDCFEDVLKEE